MIFLSSFDQKLSNFEVTQRLYTHLVWSTASNSMKSVAVDVNVYVFVEGNVFPLLIMANCWVWHQQWMTFSDDSEENESLTIGYWYFYPNCIKIFCCHASLPEIIGVV